MDLGPTLAKLDRGAGVGVSGFRHEYLKVLTRDYADARAASAITLLDRFAERYVNAELPAWFYYPFSTIKEVAPIKDTAANR